jgi:hypothetical protein
VGVKERALPFILTKPFAGAGGGRGFKKAGTICLGGGSGSFILIADVVEYLS